MSTVPIAAYALLSDCRSAALVSQEGSVDWLCFPRFDSPSVFGRLLDRDAGHWSLRLAGATKTSRRYLDATMVLETTSDTSTGTAVLTDAMAMGPNERGHQLGVDSPGVLLRVLTCTKGLVEVDMEYMPRLEYGLIAPLLKVIPGGIGARGGASILVLLLGGSGGFRTGCPCPLHVARRRGRLFCLGAPDELGRPASHTPSSCHRYVSHGYDNGMAYLVGPPPAVHRSVEGSGSSQRASIASPDVPPNWGPGCGTDNFASGIDWRGAQLGLSLHLGARFLSDAGSPLGSRLPR